MNTETHLLPPNNQPGPHVLGQDSWYKGSRLIDAFWVPEKGVWRIGEYRYGCTEVAEQGWVHVAEGSLADNGLVGSDEFIVAISAAELHSYRG